MLQRTHIGISIGLPVVKFIAPSHGVCECPQESCGIEVGVLNPHHGSKTKKNIVVLFRTRTLLLFIIILFSYLLPAPTTTTTTRIIISSLFQL